MEHVPDAPAGSPPGESLSVERYEPESDDHFGDHRRAFRRRVSIRNHESFVQRVS